MKYKLIRNRNLVEDKEFLNKNKWFVGYDKENRAEILEFEIPDTLNDYAKKINFDLGTEKVSDILNQDNTYILKNNITQYKQVSFYLEFIKEIDNNTTEILKTEVKTIEFGDSFDVNIEITEEEISIIDTLIAQTNSAINRANAISQDLENKVATDYYRGATGENGADAKINGVNTLTIEAGTNITLDQEGNTLTINSTGGSGGTSNYNALTNKPKINNVELNGNKTSSDLGIQPAGDYALESEIPDVSNFITNSVNNLLNYYLKSETYTKQEVNNLIGQIATLQFQVVSTLPQTGDSKYIYLVPSSNPKIQNVKDEYIWVNNSWEQIGSTQIDLTGYATENWVNTQISGFLTQTQIQALINTALSEYTETDPTVPSYVKNITQANITSWNNKSDFSGNYNDLTNKPTIPTVPTNVSAFTNDVGYLTEHQDISGKANKISVVQTSTSTIEINSNTFYKFGEVTELNLTLTEITDTTQLNEFMFEFVSGSTATTLTLPNTIKWLETPTIESNKIYQCSIVDNIGVLLGVANV